jgi:Ala-tRNA(Pro) deacylase
MKLDDFLHTRQIRFMKLHHPPAYTAHRIAQALHVPGREMAKSVLLKTKHGYVLAVVPATHKVNMEDVRDCLGEPVEMADEEEMDTLFPDCECGAMPPFGSLYHLETLVDETLAKDEEIVIEAQTHEDAIRMAYRDFEAVEHPRRGQFAFRG